MPSTPIPRLLIIGASTRAAAWSAFRAGFQPVCADQFADRDLQQIAEVIPVPDYPNGLPQLTANVSTDAWMFVGAMENHGSVLREIHHSANCGFYCGPAPAAVVRLRDPLWLADRLAPIDCYPPVCLSPPLSASETHSADRWLRKPLAGGGGRAISLDADPPSSDEPCYLQRFQAGIPYSALFLISAGACQLLMLSRQLIGLTPAAAPSPFAYCGSLGPWPISPQEHDQLLNMAKTLTAGLEYRGLLGIDLIWDNHRFWVVEVNPRYTASTELWELGAGRSAVGEHLAACGFGLHQTRIAPLPVRAPSITRLRGKLILYADRNLVAPDLWRGLASRSPWSSPLLADIPQQGITIPAGSPICTIFATDHASAGCLAKLIRRARRIRRLFPDAENSTRIDNNS